MADDCEASRGVSGSSEEEGPSVPECLEWTVEQVADWIEELGFREYKSCFLSNQISGRRLIWVTTSTLPRMGINDWKHILFIANKVRVLLGVEKPFWNRSITLPHRDELGMFLEQKSFSGCQSDQLQFTPTK